MPLNDADRAWIRETITSAHTRRGLGKLTGFIKDWGGTGAAVAILLFAFSKWENYVEFRTTTNSRLTALDSRLTGIESRLTAVEQALGKIQGTLSQLSLTNYAALPLRDFKVVLPDLRSTIAGAKEQNVKVSPAIIGDLGTKLTASTNAPQFWPAAAEFINYRSQVTGNDIQSLTRSDLPNCTDHNPTPMELIVNEEIEKHGKFNDTFMLPDTPEGKDDKGNQLVPARYENCRFILDSAEQAERIPFVADKRAFRLMFKHCQIVYRGGPIALLAPDLTVNILRSKAGFLYSMVGQRLYFENCLFLFVINSKPPNEGQWLTTQLLSQSGPHLIVSEPKPATHS